MRALVRLAALLLVCAGAWSQETVARPRITGIAHVAYFVSDLPGAVAFWHGFLGFAEAGSPPKPDGISFIRINDRQHVELIGHAPTKPNYRMSELCFAVDNLAKMQAYLRAQGFDGMPTRTRGGESAIEIMDPNGAAIEFVESRPGSGEAKPAGIAARIYHVGYMVGDSRKTLAFYAKLGFVETWRGGGDPKQLSWINLKVPDGDDYVELMLYGALPDTSRWGSMNHTSLVVPDVERAVVLLKSRPYFQSYGKELTVKTGVNGKRQLNLFDPDGTRVELMEPNTASGKPVPSSTAPPPQR
jgi:lactoylglutathione lyase